MWRVGMGSCRLVAVGYWLLPDGTWYLVPGIWFLIFLRILCAFCASAVGFGFQFQTTKSREKLAAL